MYIYIYRFPCISEGAVTFIRRKSRLKQQQKKKIRATVEHAIFIATPGAKSSGKVRFISNGKFYCTIFIPRARVSNSDTASEKKKLLPEVGETGLNRIPELRFPIRTLVDNYRATSTSVVQTERLCARTALVYFYHKLLFP